MTRGNGPFVFRNGVVIREKSIDPPDDTRPERNYEPRYCSAPPHAVGPDRQGWCEHCSSTPHKRTP